ncbi:PAS domain-containing protein [Methylobacterium radiotolerans]|uniref:PAS domain-containing protein n=1 Tax=Methylobacterium radiotolerans TaxID=31998 RepID=UPI001F295896|nr:PAS domain-containing protein [Methylobacterium radiotolerans]UIY43537.1 PAS domain-containing protein [Methylobacterium radiotolerans]
MSLFANFDWSKTPLGPRDAWSPALSTIYDMMMSAHVAMCATWGPEGTFLYNAAYAPFLGGRHPALGRPMREAWPEIWNELEPLIARAMAGERVQFSNYHLVMTRNGQPEDTWWDFSYSALREGGEVKGFLNVATEATHHVLSDQRRDMDEVALRAENTVLARTVTNRTEERDVARAGEISALADAERIQLALAAGAILGTWTWDIPTDCFTVDEAFATNFGLDPALGRQGIPFAQIVATVHTDDQPALANAIDEAVARGGALLVKT